MGFEFRLEVSLRLAEQELDKAQELLAQELRKLWQIQEVYHEEQKISLSVLQEQEKACRYEPQALGGWHVFSNNQKQKMEEILVEIQKQEEVISRLREGLKMCKIKTEKFKKLRSRQWQEYCIEQLRKEQLFIDEVAQQCHGQVFRT